MTSFVNGLANYHVNFSTVYVSMVKTWRRILQHFPRASVGSPIGV